VDDGSVVDMLVCAALLLITVLDFDCVLRTILVTSMAQLNSRFGVLGFDDERSRGNVDVERLI
jgi:hypothetical protein